MMARRGADTEHRLHSLGGAIMPGTYEKCERVCVF